MALPKLLLTKVLLNMLMGTSTEQLSTATILASPRATISPRVTTSPRAYLKTTATLRASHMAQTQSVRERELMW